MCVKNITTDRLILIPITFKMTQALLKGSIKEITKSGFKVDKSWPRNDTQDILPIVHELLKKQKVPSGFELWMIVKKETNTVIGDIGFHGKPNKRGKVEIGYGFVSHERGKGYGFEALSAMINWAKNQQEVKVIKADCLVDNKASARILEKVGMKEVYRDDELIYWEIVKKLKQK